MKSRWIMILSACLLVMAGTAFLLLVPNPAKEELHIQGQPLSHWLDEAAQAKTPQSQKAILQAGTNTLPHLVDKLVPVEKSRVVELEEEVRRKAWSTLKISLPRLTQASQDEWRGALAAFEILGTNAASAIPQLAEMLKDERSYPGTRAVSTLAPFSTPGVGYHASRALASIGEPAFPVLLNALASTNSVERSNAMSGLYQMKHTRQHLYALLAAWDEPERYDPHSILSLLGAYRDYPKEIVPFLIDNLHREKYRRQVVTGLVRFEEDAAPALPYLEALLPADTFRRVPKYLFAAVDQIKAAVEQAEGPANSAQPRSAR